MKRFKNILFFVDGRDDHSHSLQRVLQLAESNDARLTLIDVIEPVDTPKEVESQISTDLTSLLKKERKQALEALIAELELDEQIIYSKVLVGIPFIEVIKFVQTNHIDLLAKVASPPTDIGEQLFGGNDLHLLRKCPCPVLIDHPNATQNYQRVLAAVALDDADGCSCDTLIMQLATSLAQREQAKVDIVHTWHLPGESSFRSGRVRLSKSKLDLMLDSEEKLHRDKFQQLLRDYGMQVNDHNVHLLKGTTSKTINSLAKSIQADVIVMGTVGRVGIPGLFIGNTAENVLQTTTSAVLAVKPEGFESPVK